MKEQYNISYFLNFEQHVYPYFNPLIEKWGIANADGHVLIQAFSEEEPIFDEGFYFTELGAISSTGMFLNGVSKNKYNFVLQGQSEEEDIIVLFNGRAIPRRSVESISNNMILIKNDYLGITHFELLDSWGNLLVTFPLKSTATWAFLERDHEYTGIRGLMEHPSHSPRNIWIQPDGLITYEALDGSKNMYLASQGKKLFFIDNNRENNINLDCYDSVNPYSEGLAKVSIDGKFGYINELGQVVISCKYDYATDFFKGQATVCEYGFKRNYIKLRFDQTEITTLPEQVRNSIEKSLDKLKKFVKKTKNSITVDLKKVYHIDDVDEANNNNEKALEVLGSYKEISFALMSTILTIDQNGRIVTIHEGPDLSLICRDSLVSGKNIYKFPLLNDEGNQQFIIINEKYEQIGVSKYQDLLSGLGNSQIIAKLDGLYGVIDTDNIIIIPFDYEVIRMERKDFFSYYLCEKEGFTYLIDLSGKVKSELKGLISFGFPLKNKTVLFYPGGPFEENNKFFLLNELGQIVTEYDSSTITLYDFGLRLTNPSGRYNIVIKGKTLEHDFSIVTEMGEQMLYAKIYTSETARTDNQDIVLIDEDANLYPIPSGLFYGKFIGRYASAETYSNLHGFINHKGEIVVPIIYTDSLDFSEDLAAVKLNGFWGFVDSNGKVTIPFLLDKVLRSFTNGRAWIVYLGKVYQIDAEGNLYIKNMLVQKINYIVPRQEGNLWGYVNREGTYVVPPIFSKATQFNHDFAHVRLHGLDMVIDQKGKLLSMKVME